MIVFCFVLLNLSFSVFSKDLLLAMPGVKPDQEDQYLCHAMNLKNETYYITGFQPKVDADHAHHILIYGCAEPGLDKESWDCNHVSDNSKNSGPICNSQFTIIYSWAMNAPGTILPKDVSFMVGKGTDKPYLILQAHYKDIDIFKKADSRPDKSGIILHTLDTPTEKFAGIFVLIGNDLTIRAHYTASLEPSCSYNGLAVLHPFAFRTHTHKLGKMVSGYMIHNNQKTEIGRKSPQLEQMFYPVEKKLEIRPGDILGAQCLFQNDGNKDVKIGFTKNDEMCNFYIMYWVKKEDLKQLLDTNTQMCTFTGIGDMSVEKLENTGSDILQDLDVDLKKEEKLLDNIFSKDNINEGKIRKQYEDAMNFNMDEFDNENDFF